MSVFNAVERLYWIERGFHEWWGGILVLGVLAASWAHCFNSSKDTLSVFFDCTLKVKLDCSLSGLFLFFSPFLTEYFGRHRCPLSVLPSRSHWGIVS